MDWGIVWSKFLKGALITGAVGILTAIATFFASPEFASMAGGYWWFGLIVTIGTGLVTALINFLKHL